MYVNPFTFIVYYCHPKLVHMHQEIDTNSKTFAHANRNKCCHTWDEHMGFGGDQASRVRGWVGLPYD
jgi:hypothetical protein